MIPFFIRESLDLGPITVQVWGVCVAAGIFAALAFASRIIKKQALSPDLFFDVALVALVSAFIGARLFHVAFYEWSFYAQFPGEILQVWHGGMSSLGGFVGAGVGAALYLRLKKISWSMFVPYADIGVWCLWLGWGIGRIGCFLIHDHPGTLSHFVLAVQYPGGARHDLGLYESLLGFGLFIGCTLLFPKLSQKGSGRLAAGSIAAYAVARFGLDFWRVNDVRYGYLTPAQWGMIAVVFVLTARQVFSKLPPLQGKGQEK